MTARGSTIVRASLTLFGTIVGAGVFALPAAMNAVGILLGSLLYWALVLVILAVHLLYADIILSSVRLSPHRLPGQVGHVIGPWAQRVAFVTQPLHIIGACLVYLILGGEFLGVIAEHLGIGLPLLFWQIVFWGMGAFVVRYGLKTVVRAEGILTRSLIGLMSVLIAAYAVSADGFRFLDWHPSAIGSVIGVFVFATFGLLIVPEIVEITGRRRESARLAIAFGTFGAALLMWLFAVFAAAADPSIHSPTDLIRTLPAWLAWVIPVVGFFAVSETFLAQTQDLRATFEYDARQKPFAAYAIAVGAPLLLLLFVTRDFLATVSFVGAVFSSINAIFVGWMAFRLRRAPVIAACVIGVFLFILVRGILSIF